MGFNAQCSSNASREFALTGYHEIPVAKANKLRRLELQCRLLARQSSKEIAYELDAIPEVIELYHDLFYDVRSQLDTMTDHLFQHVIGISLTGLSPVEAYARMTAHRNGPGTIPAWIDYLPHRLEDHDLTTQIGRQRESISQYLTAEALLRTPAPDDQPIQCLGEIQYHFSRPKPPRLVTEIVQSLTCRMLQERSVAMPENAAAVSVELDASEWSDALAGCA